MSTSATFRRGPVVDRLPQNGYSLSTAKGIFRPSPGRVSAQSDGVAMELRNAVLGDSPMLVATGTIDHDTCGVLQAALESVVESGHNVIFLDLSDVASFDSDGLSVLVAGVRALRRGWLGVIGPNADIRRLLEMEGLLVDPHLRIFETRQAARTATGERAST